MNYKKFIKAINDRDFCEVGNQQNECPQQVNKRG
jgi:hypothetical protein